MSLQVDSGFASNAAKVSACASMRKKIWRPQTARSGSDKIRLRSLPRFNTARMHANAASRYAVYQA
jgi:hypothetical protein